MFTKGLFLPYSDHYKNPGMYCEDIEKQGLAVYSLYLLTPDPPPPQATPSTVIDLHPDLAAAIMSFGEGLVIRL